MLRSRPALWTSLSDNQRERERESIAIALIDLDGKEMRLSQRRFDLIVFLIISYARCSHSVRSLVGCFFNRWLKDIKHNITSSTHPSSSIPTTHNLNTFTLTTRGGRSHTSSLRRFSTQSTSSPEQSSNSFESTSSSAQSSESVHLKLREIQSSFSQNNEDIERPIQLSETTATTTNPTAATSSHASTTTPKTHNTILISEYRNVDTNELLLAIHGWNKTRLELFSEHVYGINFSQSPSTYSYDEREVDCSNNEEYEQYLALWKQSKFLTQKKTLDDDWKRDKASISNSSTSPSPPKRLPTVETIMTQNLSKMQLIDREYNSTLAHLTSFLRDNVSTIHNHSIDHYTFQTHRSVEDHLAVLKSFSVWFREVFPYYYDGCLQSHCLNRRGNEYFGSVYSNDVERNFHSGKTELYLCSHCLQLSRFPRYNDMKQVVAMKRGRCGEYSILMMLMLKSLQYEARYVVDRDDHAWTEVLLGGQWIHIDPCEAAINEPLIYQHWGKNQTFILAMDLAEGEIEDVTHHYTNQPSAIYERRLEEGMDEGTFRTFLNKSKQSFQLLLDRGGRRRESEEENSQ